MILKAQSENSSVLINKYIFSTVKVVRNINLNILPCGMCAKSCPTICSPLDYNPPGSSVHGIFLEKNTVMDCHFLLQGIFLTQGMNPCLLHLLHWQADSLLDVPLGKPCGGYNKETKRHSFPSHLRYHLLP